MDIRSSYLRSGDAIVLLSAATAGVEGEQLQPAHHDRRFAPKVCGVVQHDQVHVGACQVSRDEVKNCMATRGVVSRQLVLGVKHLAIHKYENVLPLDGQIDGVDVMTSLQVSEFASTSQSEDVSFNWQPERRVFVMQCHVIAFLASGFEKLIVGVARETSATEIRAAASFLDWVGLGAPGAGNSDSESQDAPGRLLTCLGLVPGVGDADVEAAAVVVAQDTGQDIPSEVVLVGDDAVVNPKYALVDRVCHPAAALFVEVYPIGRAERDSGGGGQ
jgi:hypothetical protein